MKKKCLFGLVIVYLITFLNFETALANKYFFDIYDHWAQDAIIWGTNKVRLFNGYEDGTFRPNDSISRSEYTSVLYRVAKMQGVIADNTRKLAIDNPGDVTSNEDILNYKDMSDTFWAYNDILQVATFINNSNEAIDFSKIFTGDMFEPNKAITREEAVMLSYFFTSPAVKEKDNQFSDIDDKYSYKKQIYQLANNEIIKGYTDNTFKPKNGITRGESATIIKRIYDDMEYLKTTYLKGIQLVKTSDAITHPLFGDYKLIALEESDLLYKRAIETFEYQSIMGIIPYEEKHLYDSDPVETLKKLKEQGYWNNIGINYYLIKYDRMDSEVKARFTQEMVKSYLDGVTLNDNELMLIFREAVKVGEDIELILQGLNKWYNTAEEDTFKYNALFMISELHAYKGQFEKAIKLYEVDLEQSSLEIQRKFFMNKAYIYLLEDKLNEAESTLRNGWDVIKADKRYFQNKNENDKQFIGALKEVLIQKRINQSN